MSQSFVNIQVINSIVLALDMIYFFCIFHLLVCVLPNIDLCVCDFAICDRSI